MAHGQLVERHVQAISTLNGGEIWFAEPCRGEVVPVIPCGTGTHRASSFRARKPVVRHITRALLRAAEEASDFDLIHLHVAYQRDVQRGNSLANGASHSFSQNTGRPTMQTNAHHPLLRKMVHAHGKNGVCCAGFEGLANSMRNFGMLGKYTVVPNVVDTELFRPTADVPKRGTFHALHISSLRDDQKNVSGLLRAVAIALEFCSNLRVAIIGDGDPAPYKCKRRTRHRRRGRNLRRDHIGRSGGACGIPSAAFNRYENFPCVIPEAWASGIPVLSSDVGGIENLTPERGTLIASEDESALAQSLIQWAQHPDQFNPQSLREYAESTFSVEAVAQAYDDVYREAITRKTTAR